MAEAVAHLNLNELGVSFSKWSLLQEDGTISSPPPPPGLCDMTQGPNQHDPR